DNAPMGGVYQYNHSMLCKFATSDFRVSAVQLEHSNSLSDRQQELGVEQYWLDGEFLSGYSRSFTDLKTPRELLSQIQPDLILFSDGWPLGNFAAKQVALELGIPYLIVVGFVDTNCVKVDRGDGIPYQQAVHYHYTQAKTAVAVSQENLNLLYNDFELPKDRGQVIYYGRPPEFFNPPNLETRQRLRQEFEIPNDAVVCFTSARLAHVKGYDLQLEALEKLKQQSGWENLYFLWAGSGIRGESVEQQIKQGVEKIGVGDRVKFLGERRDIPDLLEASDIYILPSRAEGMPLAIMEAMAKGLPVIASAVSGIPEELADTGKLLPDPKIDPQETINELAMTIQNWVVNPKLRHSVGKACKQRAEGLFKEEQMLSRYLEEIGKVWQNLSAQQSSSEASDTLSPENVRSLKNNIYYACSIWQAWERYHLEDLTGMAEALEISLKHTQLLPTETILDWIDSFGKFFQENGKKFNAYPLCQSAEWQKLTNPN
ncbi:MAG: glycosyltransferase family 4 protein, partial [Geitlerinemataceae cyanobacterium]